MKVATVVLCLFLCSKDWLIKSLAVYNVQLVLEVRIQKGLMF